MKLYIVINGDGESVGVYSTLAHASLAMERVPDCCCEERELDELPESGIWRRAEEALR